MEANEYGINSKPRTISLVLSDDGKTKFSFEIIGDIERLNKVSPNEYTAAEFWATKLYAMFQHELKTHGEIKILDNDETIEE